MNAIRHKDWYVGTKNMIEKEDMTVCKSQSKVAVIFFLFVIDTGQCVGFHMLLKNYCFFDRRRTD